MDRISPKGVTFDYVAVVYSSNLVLLLYIYYSIYGGKRYVPEKEYIHMISLYITADWSNIE